MLLTYSVYCSDVNNVTRIILTINVAKHYIFINDYYTICLSDIKLGNFMGGGLLL